jgi:dihydrofolate reductase
LLHGDIVDEVRKLKQDDGNDLRMVGSASLVRTLAAHDLVDEFQLMIDPVIVATVNVSSVTALRSGGYGSSRAA